MKQLMMVIMVITFALVFTRQDISLQVPSKNEALELLKPSKFKVQVSIICEDKNTKTLVESYVKRELRDLRDVDIVSLKPDRQLTIMLAEPTFETTGVKMGHVIAAVNYLTLVYWENIFDTTKYTNTQKHFLKTTSAAYCHYPPDLLLYTDNRNNLRDLCQKIIVDFDTRILEKQRLVKIELKKVFKE